VVACRPEPTESWQSVTKKPSACSAARGEYCRGASAKGWRDCRLPNYRGNGLRHFISKVHNRRVRRQAARSGRSAFRITGGKDGVRESRRTPGAREVYLIEEPMAAANRVDSQCRIRQAT